MNYFTAVGIKTPQNWSTTAAYPGEQRYIQEYCVPEEQHNFTTPLMRKKVNAIKCMPLLAY